MNRRMTDEELAGALAALDIQVAQPDVSMPRTRVVKERDTALSPNRII
jgi:hypothetical protein